LTKAAGRASRLRPLRIVYRHALGAAITASLLVVAIGLADVELARSAITTFLAVKAGLIGVVTSAAFFFYKAFFDDVNDTRRQLWADLVLAYRDFFRFLLPTDLLLFISAGTDFFSITTGCTHKWLIAGSLGTFGAALLMLLYFALRFAYRVFDELDRVTALAQFKNQTPAGDAEGAPPPAPAKDTEPEPPTA
jgi:hypothetical protein